MFKKRANRPTNNIRKRQTTPSESSSSSSGSEDEAGVKVKRRKILGQVHSTQQSTTKADLDKDVLKNHTFEGDRSKQITDNDDATKRSNWYESDDKLDSKTLLGTTRAKLTAENGADGLYKGQANYQSFVPKNPDAPSRQVGPVKAPTNVRTITITDFAPDVCKDYKQTGFCGFGDSCKFLHAREDYKQGWQLDRDWEIGSKGKGKGKDGGKTADGAEQDEDEALLEKIPFACIICKKPYTNPIITKCGHYFCESCALQKYRKSPNCAACGSGTGGVFNGAKQLKRLLDKKRERIRQRRKEAREAGEEVESGSSEDEAAK